MNIDLTKELGLLDADCPIFLYDLMEKVAYRRVHKLYTIQSILTCPVEKKIQWIIILQFFLHKRSKRPAGLLPHPQAILHLPLIQNTDP